jgi:uncharacterized membrane protein
MKRTPALAIPVFALIAITAIAGVYAVLDVSGMTQEQKDLEVQTLQARQEMIQNQISYLRGELTQQQLLQKFQANLDETQSLMQQFRETAGNATANSCGCDGRHPEMFGRGMM